jgi:hypothetical protein
VQVETGNTPSFFLNWWFRTSNCEPPQLASCAIDLSKCDENKEHQTHADCDRQQPGDAHTTDDDGSKHVHGVPEPATRDQYKHNEQEEEADKRHQHREEDDSEHEEEADKLNHHEVVGGSVPDDYHMFDSLLSQPFRIQDCAWAAGTRRFNTIPSSTGLDNIPEHKLHKMSLVVKDKDPALRNATVTDTVVPVGQKVVHINCFAHAMMHVEKCAPGCLELRDGLRFCLKWLKRIDEGNKVRVLESCVLFGFAQPTHAHSVVAGPLSLPLLCTDHALENCCQ